MNDNLLDAIALTIPIFQAPMAGVSTPAMAGAVSQAGGLGALGLGAATAEAAAQAIRATQALTSRPFNANFFCHRPAASDRDVERRWIERAAPLFTRFGAEPPVALDEIYTSFRADDAMLAVLLETRPTVASFHFGLPRPDQLAALRHAGIRLVASATSLAEARQIEQAGFDAVVAQGWEAGGHRSIFDTDTDDERLDTEALTRLLARQTRLPVIAAGGLMDGRDAARALSWGALAVQMGTAFIGCPESAADTAYRTRLTEGGDTTMTCVISGRPARCLSNPFTEWGRDIPSSAIPAYPFAYALGKALNAAAKAAGETGYGAQWSGTGARRARAMPAAELMARLAAEMGGRQTG